MDFTFTSAQLINIILHLDQHIPIFGCRIKPNIPKPITLRHSLSQILLFTILLCFTWPTVFAKEPLITSNTSSSVSKKTLLAKIKEVEASTSLDAEVQSKLLELYRKTLSYQETTITNVKDATLFLKARDGAGAEARIIRQEIEKATQLSDDIKLQLTKRTPIDKVEQQLIKEKKKLALLDAQLIDVLQQLAYEAERSTVVEQRIAARKKEQLEIVELLAAPPVSDESSQFREARLWMLQEHVETMRSEIRMLDEELLSQPMRIELHEAQRNKFRLDKKVLKVRQSLLASLLIALQRSQVILAAEKAADDTLNAMNKHPVVLALAEENSSLSDLSSELVSEITMITQVIEITTGELSEISKRFQIAKKKLGIDGVSQALGRVLLEQRRSLPDIAPLNIQINKREHLVADASLRQIQFEEESRAVNNTNNYIASLTNALKPEEVNVIRGDLEDLLENRRKLMKKAITLNKSYLRAQEALDKNQKELINVSAEYNAYLAERLLWIRSSPPISLSSFKLVPAQFAVLYSLENWQQVRSVLLLQLTSTSWLALFLLLFMITLLKTPALYRKMHEFAKLANNPLRGKISDSIKALGLTLLIAASWPFLFFVIAWQLKISLESTPFTSAVSQGFVNVSLVFFFFRISSVLLVSGGIASVLFNWQTQYLFQLRRGVLQFTYFFTPLIFIISFVSRYETENLGVGLGRIGLVFTLLLLSTMTYRLFRLQGKISIDGNKRAEFNDSARLRYVWLVIGIAVPVFLAVIAMLGYMYTAGTFMERLLYSLWLVFGLLIVHQLAVRWLTMARRRIKHQTLLEKRAELQKAEDEDIIETPPIISSDTIADNLITLDLESRKLLNTVMIVFSVTGLWLIWSDILPAFGILDDVTLWYSSGNVDGIEQLIPVTLADLGISLLVVFITIVGVRSVPALIELVLLQRLGVNKGSSYATTTLTRYAIISLGTLLSLSAVGANWSQVQWLVAALSVGIGFGLQEIVANFISGLIILFERPIRVGDVVTVGDSTGTVTRIQIRATTILTYDRQELLVPNKEFITERLLNWSLSDPVSRIVLPVGIAYGADVDLAKSILEEVAAGNERVLTNPAAFVIFESFGDNSLLLKLRCFVGSIDYRLSVIGELHEEINRRFADAEISIAFPQRDIHLDTSKPLDIRVHQANPNILNG